MSDTPYIAVGANEMGDDLGDAITCPHCGEKHKVENGKEKDKNGNMVESSLLQFYKCGDNAYLIGIKGKAIR